MEGPLAITSSEDLVLVAFRSHFPPEYPLLRAAAYISFLGIFCQETTLYREARRLIVLIN